MEREVKRIHQRVHFGQLRLPGPRPAPARGPHPSSGWLASCWIQPTRGDGGSILGGKPFQQPDELLALVRALRARGCRHILACSGYTYERLQCLAERQPAIGAVFDESECRS
jgi:hypothetical protein